MIRGNIFADTRRNVDAGFHFERYKVKCRPAEATDGLRRVLGDLYTEDNFPALYINVKELVDYIKGFLYKRIPHTIVGCLMHVQKCGFSAWFSIRPFKGSPLQKPFDNPLTNLTGVSTFLENGKWGRGNQSLVWEDCLSDGPQKDASLPAQSCTSRPNAARTRDPARRKAATSGGTKNDSDKRRGKVG